MPGEILTAVCLLGAAQGMVVAAALAGGFFVLTFLGFRYSSLFGAARAARRAVATEELRALGATVRGALERDQRYLDPELTLTRLADELALPRGQVSRAVNQGLGQPFLELVNGYRVEEGRRLLTDRSFDHLTIDAVSRRAGFASRSAFYEAFWRHAGMTPGEARGEPPAPARSSRRPSLRRPDSRRASCFAGSSEATRSPCPIPSPYPRSAGDATS